MKISDYVKFENKKCLISVKITPKSAKTELFGILDNGVLKIRAKGVPEKGKVNLEIIKFLSRELKINVKNILIISGKTDQNKKIMIVQD